MSLCYPLIYTLTALKCMSRWTATHATFAISPMLEAAYLLKYPIPSTLMPEAVELGVMPYLSAC